MIQTVNSIPAFDLKQQYNAIEEEVSAAVLEVLASGGYIGGSIVAGLEQQLADYIEESSLQYWLSLHLRHGSLQHFKVLFSFHLNYITTARENMRPRIFTFLT